MDLIDIATAVERYENGESAPAIAADLGVTNAAVYNTLKKQNVTVRPKGTRSGKGGDPAYRERDLLMAKLYTDENMTLEQVAERFGVTRQRVQQVLARLGVQIRPRGDYPRERMLTAEQERDAVGRYEAGERTVDIANAFGVSIHVVYGCLHRAGVPCRNPGAARKEFDVDEAAAMYESGMSVFDIAPHFGVSAMCIHRRLKEHGVKFRPSGPKAASRLTDAQVNKIAPMYKAGSTIKRIALTFGVSCRTITWHLDRQGVKRRPRGRLAKKAA